MKNKIVILCGSFNPVTKAHVETLTKSMEFVGANEGIFVPTSYEHIYSKMIKTKGRMDLSNELRIKMLEAVCQNDSRLSVCKYEIDNNIVSDTKGTLEYIINNNPNSIIYYTCGADKLKSFTKWKNIDEILKKVEILLFQRSDISSESIIGNNPILNKYKDKFHSMNNISDCSISSTKIRNLFLSGNPEYKKFLPNGVSEIFSQLNPSDYPELSLCEWIKLMHKYGGMHGADISLKELYNENKKIIKNKIEGSTTFYYAPKSNNQDLKFDSQITCVNSDLITEYKKLKENNFNPVIINVCNAARACGKYDMGYYKTISDEEEICRISNLSNYLYPYGSLKLKAVKDCNINHINEVYPLSHNAVIYCNDVLVFRNNKNKWYTMLQEHIKCDIILTPAISLRDAETTILKKDLQYKKNDGHLTEDGRNVLKNSIINTFEVAIINNKDSVILGDLGMKSYYISESDIVEILTDVLKNYQTKFKKIVIVLPFKKINSYKQFYEFFKDN